MVCIAVIVEDHKLHIFLPPLFWKGKHFHKISTFIISFSMILKFSVIHLNLCREEKLVERAKALKVNIGTDPEADLGPVISKQVRTESKSSITIIASARTFINSFLPLSSS